MAIGGFTYYDLLGVPRSATLDEIEQAYRRYVAEAHPDKFFDDARRREQAQEKMKQVNAVMQVLRDPVRRKRYDNSGRG